MIKNVSEQRLRLILLPGLGTDKRLFEHQRRAFPDLSVLPWILPHTGEKLTDYAVRMARGVDTGEPFILGGVSLGGMIAYEIARHLKSRAVMLIASCRTREGIRGFFRAAGRLWPAVPPDAVKVVKFVSMPALLMFGRLTSAERRLCAEMFAESDPGFVHWAISAILNWEPSPIGETPVFQIHGARDQIIPAKCVQADEIIHDGGHLINLTHADEVNRFIKSVIANIQSR
jgi:pimeloyl-ACP methyl ester carboxylesterase